MFAPPPVMETELFTTVPPDLRFPGRTSRWTALMRHGTPTDCFIEGPAFDRDGNLYVVDIPWGRIFRIDRNRRFSIAAEYDGEPCGLQFHRDGRLFVADFAHGLMTVDLANGTVTPLLERPLLERFKGVNDLAFASNGDLYFTDQGQTGLHDPTGRLFCLRDGGRLDLLIDNVPSPNGLVLSPDETVLYLAVTRANAIWRVPLLPEGKIAKVGVFVQLSGSLAGPDGLAIDEAGNLVIAHAGLGVAWVFSRLGEPMFRIQSRTGIVITNLAYGWPDRDTLYITESDTGNILRARLPTPGAAMFSHLGAQ